jgi:hypothetical protein
MASGLNHFDFKADHQDSEGAPMPPQSTVRAIGSIPKQASEIQSNFIKISECYQDMIFDYFDLH